MAPVITYSGSATPPVNLRTNTLRRITLVTHSGTATRTNDATGFGFNMLSEEGSEGEAGAGTNVGARGRMDGWSM